MLVHIYNYAYSFGASMKREIKGILVNLIACRQTGALDITRFSLLLPILGFPPGFMQNSGSASDCQKQAFTYCIGFYVVEGVFNVAASTYICVD